MIIISCFLPSHSNISPLSCVVVVRQGLTVFKIFVLTFLLIQIIELELVSTECDLT